MRVVELSHRDEAALITLNRPQALNALSFAILDELDAMISEVARSGARVLLVTGAGGKAFCAGADIKELRNRDLAAQKRGAENGQAILSRLSTLPMPSIAVINGYAFGGGLELAMACTFRIA
ncbi:MAG: enoyl-CoA hydratase, partial [Burkholderiales bacterium]|nr:enoyl-CoA hydratase [Burkholderiales bacterium]